MSGKIGVCSRVIAAQKTQDSRKIIIQLFPSGEFRASDSRPWDVKNWVLTETEAAELIARTKRYEKDLVLDYDHQTLGTGYNRTAPAAGWFSGDDLEFRAGEGLFAAVTLTPKAAQHITDDEYRYISPVFTYDETTGAILTLLSAALTNSPALDMAAVEIAEAAARVIFTDPKHSNTQPYTDMTPKNTGAEEKNAGADTAALTQLRTENDRLLQELEKIKAGAEAAEKERIFDAALKDGKVLPAHREVLMRLSPEDMKKYAEACGVQKIFAAAQSERAETGTDSLSKEEAEVCSRLGISEADFLKQKQQKQKQKQ